MKYPVSQFIYCFEYDNKYYIVQTFTKKLFQIEKEIYGQLKNGHTVIDIDDEVTLEAFEKAQIINPKVTFNDLKKKSELEDNDKEWHSLHIIPTASCNFGCEYCFVLKDKINDICDGIITDEILYKGIDFFFEDNPSEKPLVTFYGGEPFIAPDIIYKSVYYIENVLKRQINKKVITNGTLVTQELSEFLAERDFDVNVSLDGNRDAQDAFRVYKNGSSTFDDVVKGIKLLKKYGNSVKLLLTVGDFNASNLVTHVKQLLELEPTTIALNLPKALQNNDNKIERTINYYKLLENYLNCVDICYEQHIPEGHMADIVYGFVRDEVQYRPCHGCGKQIALTPNGMVGPCQAYLGTQKYFSKLCCYKNKDELRKNDAFKKWSKITMFRCQKCKSCFLLPVCSGDCPYDWENRSGSLTDVPETYCISRKAMFDYMIKRIVQGKSILFHPNCHECFD